MTTDSGADNESYVIPAQTLRGSRQEILATIDQSIVGLLALRHLIAGEALVIPGTDATRAADPARKSIPTFMAQVGRFFSNFMHGQGRTPGS